MLPAQAQFADEAFGRGECGADLPAKRQTEPAKHLADGDRRLIAGEEAHVLARRPGNEERRRSRALQLRDQPVGALAEAERNLASRRQPRGQARGEHPRLLGIPPPQAKRPDRGHAAPPVDGEAQRDLVVARGEIARLPGQRVGQPRLDCGIAQLSGEIHRISARVTIEDHRAEFALGPGIAHRA